MTDRRLLNVVTVTALGTLLFGGFFKPSSLVAALPFDITRVALVAVLLLNAHAVISRRELRVPKAVILLLLVALAGLVAPPSTGYATSARFGLLVTMFAALSVAHLIRSAEQVRAWVWMHVAVGVLLVLLAWREGTTDTYGRFAVAGGSTIAAAQASGIAIVVLMVMLLFGGIRHRVLAAAAAMAVAVLALALVQTGSRGPVLAAAVAIMSTLMLAPQRRRLLRVVGGVGALVAARELLASTSGSGAERLRLAISGGLDNTETRRPLWEAAWRSINEHPWVGVGWGNFYDALPAGIQMTGYRQYPHNFVLQAAAEAGVLAGVAVLVLAIGALVRLRRRIVDAYGASLFAICAFFTVAASVSGDMSDNRPLFAAIALGWALRRGEVAGVRQSGRARSASSAGRSRASALSPRR